MCRRPVIPVVLEERGSSLMNAKLLLLPFVALLFIGCSKAVEKNQLPGIYTAGLLATLELRADGTYRNTYQTADGRKVIDEDKWQFETVENAPTVTLRNFRCTLPGVKAAGGGFFLARVTWNGSKLRLWVDEDQGVFFERQPNQTVGVGATRVMAAGARGAIEDVKPSRRRRQAEDVRS